MRRHRQAAGGVFVDVGVVQPYLELAAVLVPVVEDVAALVGRHQAQEIDLGAVADQVEVQARLQLVRHITEDVEVHRQLVVGALQQRVVEQPGGQRNLTGQAFGDRGTVEVAEDAQQRVVVACP